MDKNTLTQLLYVLLRSMRIGDQVEDILSKLSSID